ncbi:MAG: hypothetical protein WC613_05905 [Candidatus Aenigmatarchaeota archaeon]
MSEVCKTDDEHIWKRIEGFYAVTRVDRQGGNTIFNPDVGIPLEVYVCSKCHLIRLFAAKSKGSFDG